LGKDKAFRCGARVIGGAAGATIAFSFLMLFAAQVASGDKNYVFGVMIMIPALLFGTIFMLVSIFAYQEAMFDLNHLSRHDK
jgi:hypothetical protein